MPALTEQIEKIEKIRDLFINSKFCPCCGLLEFVFCKARKRVIKHLTICVSKIWCIHNTTPDLTEFER